MGAVGLLNRVVDPFWYYRDVSIEGFNAVKTKFRRFERHVKPAVLAREKPEAISVGSSLTEISFDPRNDAFTDDGRLKGFNFAVAGAPWQIIQCYFEYAVAHAPIKRAVVEVRPMEQADADCATPAAALDTATPAQLLFSARALKASIQTIRGQRDERPSHTREGLYFYARYDPGMESRFREMLGARLKAGNCNLSALREGAPTAAVAMKDQPKQKLDLSGLRKVVRIAVEKGIELRLVVHPRHVYDYEMDALCPTGFDEWDVLRQMASVVRDASGGDDRIQLWEFIGYNAITGEPVSAHMKLWQDPWHLNFEVGDIMLNAMFGRRSPGSPDIGRRVFPENVDSIRRDFLEGRESFIKTHPWFYPGLRRLLASGGD
jgi:hypothetical protein